MTDDVQRARELLAMCLDEWGSPTEASNVRAGEDLESYESDFRLLQQLRVWGLLQYPQEGATLRAAPEGFVMVPVDLRTGSGYEVWEAGIRVRYMGGSVEEMWAAMIAARQQGVSDA